MPPHNGISLGARHQAPAISQDGHEVPTMTHTETHTQFLPAVAPADDIDQAARKPVGFDLGTLYAAAVIQVPSVRSESLPILSPSAYVNTKSKGKLHHA